MKRSAGSSGIVDVEEVDFLYDARSERERRWKRRRLAIESGRDGDPKRKISKNNKVANANKELVLVEEDYETFLKNLEQIYQSNVDYDAGDLCRHLDYLDVNDDDNEDDAGGVLDPEYAMFFKNLKEDGESYLLEFVESDGMQVVVKYEEVSRINLGREKRERPKRTVGSDSKKENENCSSILRNTSKKGKIESKTTLKNMSKKQSMGNESKLRNSRARVKCRQKVKKNEVKAEENVIRRKRGRPRKTPHTEDTHLAKRRCDHPIRSESVDESYSVFLSYLKVEGEQIVYAPEGGKRVVFEKDEDTDSNSDVMILENDQDRTPIFIDLSRDGDSVIVRSKDSNFRRELMEILQQPFSEQEYEKLWNEVSCRKPVQREKELRTRCFQFQLDHSAKSYLDHNRDFVDKMKQVGDNRARRLNLLRGFVHYLTYVADEERFKPWNDPLCF